jgi:hypothetical protein
VNGLSGTQQNILIDPGMITMIPGQYERDIALSFRFKSDSIRVLHALSIPEYIEVWLQTPDTGEQQFVFNQVAQETFQIDLYRAEGYQASIYASCRVVGANQVSYTWTTTSPLGTTESLVDMKLICGSEGCVLALKHSGFKDAVESAWCRRMWHQSLEKLCRLMDKN